MEINDNLTEEYALKVMMLARDTVTVRFRFFDAALAKYKIVSSPGLRGYLADGEHLYYDPMVLLKDYSDEPNFPVRLLLHVMLHGIFLHPYRYDKTDENYWNLASDIHVENIILNMNFPGLSLMRDDEQRTIIAKIRKWVPSMQADRIYREFAVGGLSHDSEINYKRLFTFDIHRKRASYKEEPAEILTEEDWKKITERVKAELEAFSEKGALGESIMESLVQATKPRYDFEGILRRFAVEGEEIKVNPDEFDYIYYTYGLNMYGKMPLIEPLEYTEDKKVKEFVIVIDTSASCNGKLVRNFLMKTYDVLMSSGSFFRDVNIHIIECDMKVWEDIKITDRDSFKDMVDNFRFTGFGATDFRPAFEYVDELIHKKEFTNLKGLIYFTDGYGIYPSKCPDYDVIFAFLGDDEGRAPVPGWAIKAVLEAEE